MIAPGAELFATYQGEVFSNLLGGLDTGTTAFGALTLGLDVDLNALSGWRDTFFHAHAYWFHGKDPSTEHVGDFNTLSNIAAMETARLSQLWFRKTFGNGKLAFKIGQIDIDDDFITSEFASVLINSGFGTPPTGPSGRAM